jgi:hypothetical protein
MREWLSDDKKDEVLAELIKANHRMDELEISPIVHMPYGARPSRDREPETHPPAPASEPQGRSRHRALRSVAPLLLLLALAVSCTSEQLATFQRETGQSIAPDDAANLLALPDVPMRLDDSRMIAVDGSVMPTPVSGRCARWYDFAIASGFDPAVWPRIDRIMWRESRCQPRVRNRSGASGLMQIMPMWADDCGGTRAMLLDPGFNLDCAAYILDVQGWAAWS